MTAPDTPDRFIHTRTQLLVGPSSTPGGAVSSRAERRDGITCPRCDIPTGNNTQGHYWSWCQTTRRFEDFHFCCPDDCERTTKS